ncbi:hypothetical protein NQ318_023555 [Aromia moschata]|uniref:HTH CENPB-type domain-containing protein n=1 Tax=Aromia moschata TaxID=1265417 RepID=A0AAV8YPJ3_9CUCU|nr:hypothetical protein NQ318_023555 [Aromia moschata]
MADEYQETQETQQHTSNDVTTEKAPPLQKPSVAVETPRMGRYKCVFSPEQEKELVEYVQDMESRLLGLTTELRRLAYQLAQRNSLQHNFNTDDKIAGLDWLKGFLKRHRNLSLRTPEATSAARAMGFNEVSVGKYFDLLTSVMEMYNFRPTRIYNVDETGLTTVSKSQ